MDLIRFQQSTIREEVGENMDKQLGFWKYLVCEAGVQKDGNSKINFIRNTNHLIRKCTCNS